MQSDGEIAKKVMTNEASTFFNTVAVLEAPPEGFGSEETSTASRTLKQETECSDKTSVALLSGFSKDRQKEEGDARSDHRLRTDRVLRGQAALHIHRCTQEQGFHPERDHWRVAGRHARIMLPADGNSGRVGEGRPVQQSLH